MTLAALEPIRQCHPQFRELRLCDTLKYGGGSLGLPRTLESPCSERDLLSLVQQRHRIVNVGAGMDGGGEVFDRRTKVKESTAADGKHKCLVGVRPIAAIMPADH
jgi:hypothetical protein